MKRRIVKHGNSLGINLPSQWLEMLGLQYQDEIDLILDLQDKKIYLECNVLIDLKNQLSQEAARLELLLFQNGSQQIQIAKLIKQFYPGTITQTRKLRFSQLVRELCQKREWKVDGVDLVQTNKL